MLSLGKIAAGPAAARYYTDQVALGRDDYYAGEGERPGTWVGSGAGALRLAGEVDAGRFAELLDGAGLRRPPREGAVAGFDLTFSAPKSVSVLWAVGSPDIVEELHAGHEAAVAEALGYLEREACRARRGAGGHTIVAGRGFVGAAFVHRASRAGDPALHTHVVVGNLTQGPDGRWTALDGRHIYRQLKTAGYLYQSVLRRELTERLGVEWHAVTRGVADVRGVPREVIEHFSKRRAQILERMAEHGGRSAASAQIAALETRRAKQDVPVDRLREVWRSRAAEHGLDEQVVAAVLDRDRRLSLPVGIAVNDLTEEKSTFGRPEVLQALAEAQPTGAHVDDLERLADATLSEREVVGLQDGPVPGGLTERCFSTRDMLAVERELLERSEARRRLAPRVGIAHARALDRATAGRSLSADQERVVRALCRDRVGVAILRAPAGTGKTFVMDAAREAWQASRIDVVGCAVSARAALELQDQAGIPSITIARLRHDLAHGRELPRRGVLVVDEAGMVGTRDLHRLAQAADRAEAKLVLVGDDRQLPEIQAGGAFRALADRLGASELHEVRRQRHAWDRQALDALRNGEVERWARAYRDRGHITIAASAPAARVALVNDWHRASGDRLMIAARRDDVDDLNQRARELLQAEGIVGPDELDANGRRFAKGDRVVGRRNDRTVGILNGQRGTIEAIDTDRRSLSVQLDSDKRITIPDSYLQPGHLDHGYAITAHRAQGATVDRSFVLGSDELYREWGYTALSRHRDEARFYIARGDLGPERDLPPEHDPVIGRIERLMSRSHAKDLAIHGLPEADQVDLQAEKDTLRTRLADHPAPWPKSQRLAEELQRATESLQAAHARRDRNQESRDELGWFDRRRRHDLDHVLDINAGDIERATERWQAATRAYEQADQIERDWLTDHGPEAERLLTVDAELDERDRVDRNAQRQLDRLVYTHQPLERQLDDIGMDIGL